MSMVEYVQAWERLEMRGFKFEDFTLEQNPHAVEGLRWKCVVRAAGGRQRNWGYTPLDAVLKVLAFNPTPPRRLA